MRLEKCKERFADYDSDRGWRTVDVGHLRGAIDRAADVQKLDDASAFKLGYPYEFLADIQKRW